MSQRPMPRDWICKAWPDDDDPATITIDAQEPPQRLAEVNTAGVEDDDDIEEVLAIGRLIAAAPDMLAALRRARDCIDWSEIDTEDPPENRTGTLIRAAIAKAEGE